MVMAAVLIYGMIRGCGVFEGFTEGALAGLKVVIKIAPTMVAIMLAVGMFKASGALDLLSFALEPVVSLVKIPREAVPLMLVRPISGSGALAVFKDIIERCGPDSYVGRVTSVMQGSTETTFYTLALYFGATRVRRTRHALVCSLSADVVGFVMSAITVTLLMK
ncbi:MAG: spore maturation protein [Oscillospiraceae bacterium]